MNQRLMIVILLAGSLSLAPVSGMAQMDIKGAVEHLVGAEKSSPMGPGKIQNLGIMSDMMRDMQQTGSKPMTREQHQQMNQMMGQMGQILQQMQGHMNPQMEQQHTQQLREMQRQLRHMRHEVEKQR